MQIKVKKLHPDAQIPVYAKPGDSGFDLIAAEAALLAPGETKVIKTNLAFEIPEGYEMQIRPRSGITAKTKLRVQLGTIDSNFRGNVGVIIDNISPLIGWTDNLPQDVKGSWIQDYKGDGVYYGTYLIQKGDRIAQGVISPVKSVSFWVVKELSMTERGIGGFGSTGTR